MATVLEDAERIVLPGFSTFEDARAAIVEMVEEDEDLVVTADTVEAIFDGVWARRAAEQRSWRGLSDADRLAAAFSELEANGLRPGSDGTLGTHIHVGGLDWRRPLPL